MWRDKAVGLTIVLLIVGSLASCTSGYVEPTDEDTATIVFVDQARLGYVVNMFRDATQCTDRATIQSAARLAESPTVKVSTKSELALGLYWGSGDPLAGPSSMCRNVISFQPERSRTYAIHFAVDESACHVAVGDIRGAGEVPVKISERQAIVSMSEHGPWCEPKG